MVNKYSWLFGSTIAALVIASAFFFPGCDSGAESSQTAPVKLRFLCGAALRAPMDGAGIADEEGILRRFHALNPDVKVDTTYGAGNLLLGQLKISQTGDLFFPGDEFYINEAKKDGLVYETRKVAKFTPVIMVQRGNPWGVEDVSDLAAPQLRLAVADERTAALGRITPEIFRKNGLAFNNLENIVFTGVTPSEVAQAVELGHADAAIMWRSVARQHTRNGADIDIAPDKNVISPLVIAVLETSEHKDKALKFAEFISGPTGKEVFEKYHYEWGK